VADKTAIEWSDATWNTWYGCTKVSPGCANCYIERTPPYRMAGLRFERGAIPVQLLSDRMSLPLHWKKPRLIFVNSLSDTFHEDVPDEYLAKLLNVMGQARQHTFQVLTKRPERMRQVLTNLAHNSKVLQVPFWPLPNVWLGVTAENQRMADERIPRLLDTPAAVRFVSCEPLLGPLDLSDWLRESCDINRHCLDHADLAALDWVICGGESGGPERRGLVEKCDRRRHGGFGCEYCGLSGIRPKAEALEWVTSLRDQCVAAGVPFFFKQWGGARPTFGGRELQGLYHDAMPVAARQREEAGSRD
jgi:protein gp37